MYPKADLSFSIFHQIAEMKVNTPVQNNAATTKRRLQAAITPSKELLPA